MDKQQFATLAIGIKSAYPASKILEDNASMDFWYMALKDIPYEIAENAVMEHICTNVFPPNILKAAPSFLTYVILKKFFIMVILVFSVILVLTIIFII